MIKTSCHVGGSSLRRQSGNQPSNTADGIASPRLGRSSSVGMGSGESTGSGRGPAWHHVPRALHTHGQRITTRIPSWLHLTALGEYLRKCFYLYNTQYYIVQHTDLEIFHVAIKTFHSMSYMQVLLFYQGVSCRCVACMECAEECR